MKKLIFLLAFTAGILFPSVLKSQQRVNASYYADRFHGRKTASGQVYHRDSLTCAHKTYPFGTILKITNPKNNKKVYVKVTDRGPFSRRLQVDLSQAAAKQIGIFHQGSAPVLLTRTDLKGVPNSECEWNDVLEPLTFIKQGKNSFQLPNRSSLKADSVKLSFLLCRNFIQ